MFESVKRLVELLVVPLDGHQLVCVVNMGEGVDQVGAQIWIDIIRHKLPGALSILGPVSVITHQSGGGNLRKRISFFVFFLKKTKRWKSEMFITTNELTHTAQGETETFRVTAPVS